MSTRMQIRISGSIYTYILKSMLFSFEVKKTYVCRSEPRDEDYANPDDEISGMRGKYTPPESQVQETAFRYNIYDYNTVV